MADDYGTVEVGKVANLLLLKANPLVTVEAFNAINRIVLRGQVIARDALITE